MTAGIDSQESTVIQLATFYVDRLLVALELDRVREISRPAKLTAVPHSPDFVRGVMNLRGEVVTVIDLRRLLDLPSSARPGCCRNLIISHGSELVGLMVDAIHDIQTVDSSAIEPMPANLGSADVRRFRGVYRSQDELAAILNLDVALEPAAAP